jgi:hypothetical protein
MRELYGEGNEKEGSDRKRGIAMEMRRREG